MNENEQPEAIEIPGELPVLPIRGAVVFPLAVVPISVGQERSIRLVEEVMHTNRLIALVAQRTEEGVPEKPEDLYRVGTSAVIRQIHRSENGMIQLVVQGLGRIRIDRYLAFEPYVVAKIQPAPEEPAPMGPEIDALTRTVKDIFGKLAQLTPELPDELAMAILAFDDPLQVTYLLSTTIPLSLEARQELLEIDSVVGRLHRLVEVMQQDLAVRELEQRIVDQTNVKISDTQREYVLRERLRAIQEELGETGDEAQDLRKKMEEARLPEEAKREAERELGRLERIPDVSPEHGMIRTYLEWLLSVPWQKTTGGPIDLREAREILDEDHYDLDKIKDRILDHLAVKKLRQERRAEAAAARGAAASPSQGSTASAGTSTSRQASASKEPPDSRKASASQRSPTNPPPDGAPVEKPDGAPAEKKEGIRRREIRREPILCLVGPPGTGKTSLGQSIARALGREFARASLGGIQDEAEIRGHRRTYIGAMPGRIIQALRRVGVADPVFMLDEIDKLGTGFHGDPSAALIEVLDPAQNHAFVDTYLGVPADLSQVLFICTANTIEPIPPALLDRMEIVRLVGYTDEEKVQIARRHLLPLELSSHGLRPEEIVLDDEILRRIIREYTREAGVRNMEREIATILRKVARRIGEGAKGTITVKDDDLHEYLGPRRFFDEVTERIDRPGIATGLAWTPAGGDIIFVEAAIMPGRKEELILTGMLGDVMRESAQAALSWLRSNSAKVGVEPRTLLRKTLHVHVPAGAIPKDGPSAGVALLVALVSLASGRAVRPDVAMTGEITLRGKVLPVGGIRDKVLGAYRAGIREVLLPRRNEGALEEVPDEVREAMHFIFLDTVDDALAESLEPASLPASQREELGPPLM